MLILLPPSETKSAGGDGAPLDLGSLQFPELTAVRESLIDALTSLARNPDKLQKTLRIGDKQRDDAAADDSSLRTSGTRPAIERYTGVLYDAFDYAGMTAAAKAKVLDRVAIGSALFGVVGAADMIPAYRLSAGLSLPKLGTLASQWKPVVSSAIQARNDDVVIDLRSGGYQAFGKVSGAITATVLTEKPDGSRSVVSHFNKHYKGILARSLVTSRRKANDINDIAAIVSAGGQRVEVTSPTELTVLTD